MFCLMSVTQRVLGMLHTMQMSHAALTLIIIKIKVCLSILIFLIIWKILHLLRKFVIIVGRGIVFVMQWLSRIILIQQS